MTAPLITIGITCHNAAGTIARAIDSAFAQTWPHTEVLIVDDCSTDESAKIISRAIAGEPRARLIHHQRNAGVAVARNTLVENARGEFVAYFDDDDVSVAHRLQAQWERITTYERATELQLIFCYSDRSVIEYGATRSKHQSLAIGRHAPEPHGRVVADYLLSIEVEPNFVWGQCGSCTLMARRKSFMTVGAFDANFRRCAELDLAIRAAFMGAHFIAVDRPLITQYKTLSPDKANMEPLKYQLRLRSKYCDYLKSQNFYWPSRAIARSDFHGFRGSMWKSRAWRLMALVFSPQLILVELRRRLAPIFAIRLRKLGA